MIPQLIDLWVGVICETNAFKSIEKDVAEHLPEGSVHVVHIKSVSDTYVTKFAFVVDLVGSGTSEYDKIVKGLQYRTIPILNTDKVLSFFATIIQRNQFKKTYDE